MNKNLFFVKFAHFYIINIKKIAGSADEVWDYLVNDVLPGLLYITADMLIIILRIVLLFLPVKQIILCCISVYLTEEDIEKIIGEPYHGGYFRKKDITETKEWIAQEKRKL